LKYRLTRLQSNTNRWHLSVLCMANVRNPQADARRFGAAILLRNNISPNSTNRSPTREGSP